MVMEREEDTCFFCETKLQLQIQRDETYEMRCPACQREYTFLGKYVGAERRRKRILLTLLFGLLLFEKL